MSIVDPVRFFIIAIVLLAVLQCVGVIQGPYTIPKDAWNDEEKFNQWHGETYG